MDCYIFTLEILEMFYEVIDFSSFFFVSSVNCIKDNGHYKQSSKTRAIKINKDRQEKYFTNYSVLDVKALPHLPIYIPGYQPSKEEENNDRKNEKKPTVSQRRHSLDKGDKKIVLNRQYYGDFSVSKKGIDLLQKKYPDELFPDDPYTYSERRWRLHQLFAKEVEKNSELMSDFGSRLSVFEIPREMFPYKNTWEIHTHRGEETLKIHREKYTYIKKIEENKKEIKQHQENKASLYRCNSFAQTLTYFIHNPDKNNDEKIQALKDIFWLHKGKFKMAEIAENFTYAPGVGNEFKIAQASYHEAQKRFQ